MTRTKLFPVGANSDGEWLTKDEWVMASNTATKNRTYTYNKTKVKVPYKICWAAPNLVWAVLDYFWSNEIKGVWFVQGKHTATNTLVGVKGLRLFGAKQCL